MPEFLMVDYNPLAWHDFFVGTIGAAAALTGLLFVAISINLEQILKYPELPGRAAGTLGILVGALVVSGCVLAPGQGRHALGVEIAAMGAVIAAQALWVSRVRAAPGKRGTWKLQHLATLLLPGIIMIIGGISLALEAGGGLSWVAASCLLAFVFASINAWVLLVEIKR